MPGQRATSDESGLEAPPVSWQEPGAAQVGAAEPLERLHHLFRREQGRVEGGAEGRGPMGHFFQLQDGPGRAGLGEASRPRRGQVNPRRSQQVALQRHGPTPFAGL